MLQVEGLLAAFRQAHNRFQNTVTDLKGLPLDNAQYDLDRELILAEGAHFEHIQTAEPTPTNQGEVVSALLGLNAKAEQLVRCSNTLINREVNTLAETPPAISRCCSGWPPP